MGNVTVVFDDHGQDFIEWDIKTQEGESLGVVVDSRPFQASVWNGTRVVMDSLSVGEKLVCLSPRLGEPREMNYPVTEIRSV